MTALMRFMAKVERGGPDECWPWSGYVGDQGYGQFHDGARLVKAHRFIWEAANGPVPAGLVIDHTCHNETTCRDVPCRHRACCNPRHLEAVTQAVNSQRGRTGEHHKVKTHCLKGHEYSPENTIDRGRNGRACRACSRAYQRKYNEKRKQATHGR